MAMSLVVTSLGYIRSATFDVASYQLEFNAAYSDTLFYQHYWNAMWRFNLVLGYSCIKYLHAQREVEGGSDGDMNRILFSTRFNN